MTQNNTAGELLPAEQSSTGVQQVDPSLPQSQQLMGMINVAVQKGYSPDDLRTMFDLYKESVQFEAKRAFNKAYAKMQASIPPIPKTKIGPFGPYAPLDEIEKAVKPHAKKYGFSYYWTNDWSNPDFTISTCTICHEQGHERSSPFKAFIAEQMVKEGRNVGANDMQRSGASQSYGNRRSIIDAFGLSGCDPDDNDGGSAKDDAAQNTAIRSADGTELFPIGKYKNVPWSEVPADYLEWAVKELNKPDIKARAKRELESRQAQQTVPEEEQSQEPGAPTLPELIRSIPKASTLDDLKNLWDLCPDGQKPKIKNLVNQRKQEIINEVAKGVPK